MMDKEYMNELLSGIIGSYGGLLGGISAKAVAKKLKTESVAAEIDLFATMTFGELVSVVETCGKVLETDESQGTIGAIIMSGFGGMNPAIMVIKAENQKVLVQAFAKEGLIKQHTAEKAIKVISEMLTGR